MGSESSFTSEYKDKSGVRSGHPDRSAAATRRECRSAAALARSRSDGELGNKIALSDDAVVAAFERFDPVLIVPTTHRQRSDDLIGAGQGGPGVPSGVDGLAVAEFVCEHGKQTSWRARCRRQQMKPRGDAGRFHAGRPLDGNRRAELQRDFLLHCWQMRSPDQALEKRTLHIKHCRCLVVPVSRSGLV